MTTELLTALHSQERRAKITMPDGSLSTQELSAAAAALADRLSGDGPVLLFAEPTLATVVGLAGALAAGRPVVPLAPTLGRLELEHILADARPAALLTGTTGDALPEALSTIPRVEVDPADRGTGLAPTPIDDAPALVMYTSGTTGLPKGVVLSRAAIASNIDALSEVWEWTASDRLVHSLPLFHVHGLVLGTLGPLRLGSHLVHLGRFDPHRTAGAIGAGATMLFAVPTMYHRLAAAAEADAEVAAGLRCARVLVSGSAPLSADDHARVESVCGQRIVERYGMTETLMIASMPLDGDRRAGYVGRALPGVQIRVVDEQGQEVPHDDRTIGDILVAGPSLLTTYLNRPDAMSESMDGPMFRTGDIGTVSPDGLLRIVGRKSVDLIKSGGYRIGAGEIEQALTAHPAVSEAAVVGVPDDDLGERIVAFVVPVEGTAPSDEALTRHVAAELTPHKRPREVRFVDELPRNAMGKVQKQRLSADR